MSLKTRINGFTAWVNLRLVPYDSLVNNVLTDLTKGIHVQQLLHSLTAKSLKKLQSFDGLTQTQIVTRLEWMVDELKKSEILSDEVKIDCRLIGMKVAKHMFDFLWRLVAHDIWFTWERMEFLQLNDDKALSAIPFQWTPDPPPKKKRRRVTKTADSMMSGFGSSSQIIEDPTPTPHEEEYDKYPGAEIMKASKPYLPKGGWYSYPSPDECILDMINSQLQTVSEGHKFTVLSLDDLVDSRALCGLINSFIPGTFTTEVMLNDRWTINLALSTIGKMLRASNPMGSEDFSEADPKALCAYLCFFFMSSFKLRQSKAVIRRLKELTLLIQENETELRKFPDEIESRLELSKKKEVEAALNEHKEEQTTLKDIYDIPYIQDWLLYINKIQNETRQVIAAKMKERFDLLKVSRNMTINDLCMSVAINLQLTQGAGFYRSYEKEKETCAPDRRIVLRDKKTNEFLDDFTGVEGSINIRDILGLPRNEIVIVEAIKYPQYEIYVESTSRNKTLRAGTAFLYQVFPGNTLKWQRLFFKSVRDGEIDIVKKMVFFFRESHPDFILSKEPASGNTVLHVGARFGHFDICKFLLQNGCNVNARNGVGCTPLFFSAEGLHKKVSQLLIEWGCDTKIQNFRCQTALNIVRHEEMKHSLKETSLLWIDAVPKIVKGQLDPLRLIVTDHLLGINEMADIGARCVKGSTLLHTAVHFGDSNAIKNLFKIRIDVNLRDYQGATPLHRAKTVDTVKLLIESNGDVNAPDYDGNTALHVHSYGETNKPSFIDGIKVMIDEGADLVHRNRKQLLPVHCAAMQGRTDIIDMMLLANGDAIRSEIDKEAVESPPSLSYLAITADHLECSKWLVKKGLLFKDGECNNVMYKILTNEIYLEERQNAARFLLENGGSVNLKYEDGDSCLHLAARLNGPCDILQLLLDRGSRVDAINDLGCTPLFDTMKKNNFDGSSILIKHGADIRKRNNNGITPLDLIHDIDEWITCGLFSDDVIARFKAYKLKNARDLIRSISKKLKMETQISKSLNRFQCEELTKKVQARYSMQSLTQYQSNKLSLNKKVRAASRSYSRVPRPLLSSISYATQVHPNKTEQRLVLPPVAVAKSPIPDPPRLF